MIVKASAATTVNKRQRYLENRSILTILMPHTTAPNMVEKSTVAATHDAISEKFVCRASVTALRVILYN